jgi:hypothetical protein
VTATPAQQAALEAAIQVPIAQAAALPTDANVAATLASLNTALADAKKISAPQALPTAPVITITGSTVTWAEVAATPSVDGFDVYVGGKKAVSSVWQAGVPSHIDLSAAPSTATWLGTLPIPAVGVIESVTVTAYSSLGESPQSNVVTYTTPAPPPPPPPPPPTAALVLGAYEDPSGSIALTTAFGVETHCKMSVRTEYLTQGPSDTWMGDLDYILGMWKGSPYKMCLGIPLVPYSYPPVFSQAASLVPLHTQMAAAIKASGVAVNSLRVNWELNEGTTGDFKNDPAGGIAAWKLIVPIYQEAGFLIELNTCAQNYWDVLSIVCKPLLGYYNIQSCDPYFQSYVTPLPNNQPNTPGNTSADVWATIHGGVDGLDALAAFARANDLAFAFAECGVGAKSGGYGTGDDPNGIAMYAQWIAANLDLFDRPGGYMSYFDDFPSGWDTRLADYPNALAEFIKVFPPLAG